MDRSLCDEMLAGALGILGCWTTHPEGMLVDFQSARSYTARALLCSFHRLCFALVRIRIREQADQEGKSQAEKHDP